MHDYNDSSDPINKACTEKARMIVSNFFLHKWEPCELEDAITTALITEALQSEESSVDVLSKELARVTTLLAEMRDFLKERL